MRALCLRKNPLDDTVDARYPGTIFAGVSPSTRRTAFVRPAHPHHYYWYYRINRDTRHNPDLLYILYAKDLICRVSQEEHRSGKMRVPAENDR
jgi:hypothetical protein